MSARSGHAAPPPRSTDPPFVGEQPPWSHTTPAWRRHLFAIGVGGFAVIAVAVAFVCWELAATSGCAHRAVVCVLNNNSGLVSVYGIVLAVLGAAITVLIRALDEDSERQRFVRVRRQAVYEAWHNLQHFGSSWRKYGHLGNRGDISLDRATELASDPLIKRLSASEAEQVDHMRRNFAVLGRLAWDDDSNAAGDHVRWYIEQALRFVVDVARDDKVARAMITSLHPRPATPNPDAVRDPLRSFADALADRRLRWAVKFDFAHKLVDDQAGGCHVVCWLCTADPLGPETVHILGEALAGLRDPP